MTNKQNQLADYRHGTSLSAWNNQCHFKWISSSAGNIYHCRLPTICISNCSINHYIIFNQLNWNNWTISAEKEFARLFYTNWTLKWLQFKYEKYKSISFVHDGSHWTIPSKGYRNRKRNKAIANISCSISIQNWRDSYVFSSVLIVADWLNRYRDFKDWKLASAHIKHVRYPSIKSEQNPNGVSRELVRSKFGFCSGFIEGYCTSLFEDFLFL